MGIGWVVVMGINHVWRLGSERLTYQSAGLVVMQEHEAPDITASPDLDVQNIFGSLVANVHVVPASSPLPTTVSRFTCNTKHP